MSQCSVRTLLEHALPPACITCSFGDSNAFHIRADAALPRLSLSLCQINPLRIVPNTLAETVKWSDHPCGGSVCLFLVILVLSSPPLKLLLVGTSQWMPEDV